MLVTVSDQMELSVPASEAWELYSNLTYPRVVVERVPELFDRIEVLEDKNGKAGTVILVYFKPGEHIPATPVKEKFAVVDDEKRVKVAEIVEGWFFDNGTMSSLRANFKITEKPKEEGEEDEEESCILEYGFEYGFEYEARDLEIETGAMNSMLELELINKRLARYLITNRKNKST